MKFFYKSTSQTIFISRRFNINSPKPEKQMQDLAHQFYIKPNFSNQYLRPCILKSFNHDFRFWANP